MGAGTTTRARGGTDAGRRTVGGGARARETWRALLRVLPRARPARPGPALLRSVRSGPVLLGLGLLGLGAALAGCQTQLGPAPPDDPPVFETGILSSNELNRLGREALAAGNSGTAEQHFRRAVAKDAGDVPSWIGLAAAYDNLGRFELADRAYQQAISRGGETAYILNNRGYSYLLRGDRRRAGILLRRALALEPENPVVLNNLRLLRSGERPNRAEPS